MCPIHFSLEFQDSIFRVGLEYVDKAHDVWELSSHRSCHNRRGGAQTHFWFSKILGPAYLLTEGYKVHFEGVSVTSAVLGLSFFIQRSRWQKRLKAALGCVYTVTSSSSETVFTSNHLSTCIKLYTVCTLYTVQKLFPEYMASSHSKGRHKRGIHQECIRRSTVETW